MSKPLIYLDYAAATPMDAGVLEAMQPYFTDRFYNPSATYLHAKAVASDLLTARESIAHWVGAKPSEIIFTAGGTEANNLAISGVMSQFPDGNVVFSSVEHESVREPAKQYSSKEVPVNNVGIVDVTALEAIIDDVTVVVSIMYANNEIGTVQPLREIAKLLQKITQQRRSAGNSRPLYFHTDACQAANYLDLHAARLGVDLMTLNGGKIYGPKQSGVLYVKTGVILHPQLLGGGQERGLRSGTENVAGAVGFAVALDSAQKQRSEQVVITRNHRDWLRAQLLETFPDAMVQGSQKTQLPNMLSITFPGTDNERLMMQLDERGIMCAVGSACSASKDEPSHVLKAIGLSDDEARSTLRFSVGRHTTHEHLVKTLAALKEVLHV